MFGLAEPLSACTSQLPFVEEHSLFLVNARSAIKLVIDRLSPPTVWLPSYLCPAILDAVSGGQSKVGFYEIDANLAQPSRQWMESAQQGDLVVVIDFFGFLSDADWIRGAHERGLWVLEDASQALFTQGVGSIADFVVFSPRKFVGVPDGGILNCNGEHAFESIRLKPPPAEWWLKAWFASVLRRDFDLQQADRRWFEFFRETEADAPVGPYAMSELSRVLLTKGICYSGMAQRRLDNYKLLEKALNRLALFPSLPAGVVPLGFPIRLNNRDSLRQKLFREQIYPPVHWAIEGLVPREFGESHDLSAKILTLPCDQRYDETDMDRMASIVSRELKL
jgi:dTDP-4-amino-4,6-dideoxygalactose transaminase